MKEKRKSKNQPSNKRFVIIAAILLLTLVFGVIMLFFYASTSCCTEGQTATSIVMTNEAISLWIAETDIANFAMMTAEAP
jgi:flagellar basal body-associated protein FliL